MGAIQSTNTAPQEWASLNAWMEATPLFLEQTLNYITTLGDTYSSESADEPQQTQEAEPAADAQLEASAEEAKPADEPQPSPEGKGAADAIPEKSTKDNEKRLSENFPRMHMLYEIKPMEQLENKVRNLTKELLRHGFQRGAKFQQAHMWIAQFVALAYVDITDGMVAAKRLYERVILLVSKYMDSHNFMDQYLEICAEGLERECPQLCQHFLTTTFLPPETLAHIMQGSTAKLLIDRCNPDRTWHLLMQLLDLSYAQHHTEEEIRHQVFEVVVDATTRMLVSMTDRILACGNEPCILLSALTSMVEWEGPWDAEDKFQVIIEDIKNQSIEEFVDKRLSLGSQASTHVSSGPSDDDMTDEDVLDFKKLPSLEAFHVPMETLPDFTDMRNQYLLSIKQCSYIVVVFGTEVQKKQALECLQKQCKADNNVEVLHRTATWALVDVVAKKGVDLDSTSKTFIRWCSGATRKKQLIPTKQLQTVFKYAFRKSLADGAWISPSKLIAKHGLEGLQESIAQEKKLDESLPIENREAFTKYVAQFHSGTDEKIGDLVKRAIHGLSHPGRYALLRIFRDLAKLAPKKITTVLENAKLKVPKDGNRKPRLLDIFANLGTSRNISRDEHVAFFNSLLEQESSLDKVLRFALIQLGAWNVAFNCCSGKAADAIFSQSMREDVRNLSWSYEEIVENCVKECTPFLVEQDLGDNLPAKAVINRRSLPSEFTPAAYSTQIGNAIGRTPGSTSGVSPRVERGSLIITLDDFDQEAIMKAWLEQSLDRRPVYDPQGCEILAVIPGGLGHELTKRKFFGPSDQPGLHVVTDKIKERDLRGITAHSTAVLAFVKKEAEGACQARGSEDEPQIAATGGASVHTWITWRSANMKFVDDLKVILESNEAKQRFKDKYHLEIKKVESFANLAQSCQEFDAAHPASDVAHTPRSKKTKAEPAVSDKQAVHTISHDSKRQKKM